MSDELEKRGKDCTCDQNHPSHECPFSVDSGSPQKCKCCPSCTQECAEDI